MLYFDLTGDASTTSNAISRDVEERLRLMLTLADSNIVFDLRINNGFIAVFKKIDLHENFQTHTPPIFLPYNKYQ